MNINIVADAVSGKRCHRSTKTKGDGMDWLIYAPHAMLMYCGNTGEDIPKKPENGEEKTRHVPTQIHSDTEKHIPNGGRHGI